MSKPVHVCHAEGCAIPVKQRLLMCAEHWRQVPPELKDAVNATYHPHQWKWGRRPTRAYIDSAKAAIAAVAARSATESEAT